MNLPFSLPAVNGTIAVTTTSQRIALQGAGAVVTLANVSTVECFVAVGDSTVVATAAATPAATSATDGSMSIPANSWASFAIPLDATHLAAVTAASTTTLRVSRGEGVKY